MRLDDFDPNINVEDQRGSGGGLNFGGGGGGLLLGLLPMVFSRFGCGGVAVLAIVFFVFGGGSQMLGGLPSGSPAPTERSAGKGAAASCTVDAASKVACKRVQFGRQNLGCVVRARRQAVPAAQARIL